MLLYILQLQECLLCLGCFKKWKLERGRNFKIIRKGSVCVQRFKMKGQSIEIILCFSLWYFSSLGMWKMVLNPYFFKFLT
jgi:hypothetical protein